MQIVNLSRKISLYSHLCLAQQITLQHYQINQNPTLELILHHIPPDNGINSFIGQINCSILINQCTDLRVVRNERNKYITMNTRSTNDTLTHDLPPITDHTLHQQRMLLLLWGHAMTPNQGDQPNTPLPTEHHHHMPQSSPEKH